MNLVFLGFLLFSAIVIGGMIKGLLNARRVPVLPENFDCLSPDQTAKVAIDLIERGFFLKHILRNRGVPRNDRDHFKDYAAFLDDTAINVLKDLKGDILNGYVKSC